MLDEVFFNRRLNEINFRHLIEVVLNLSLSIPDFGILLWLTPVDFTRQGGDVLDRRALKTTSLTVSGKYPTLVLYSDKHQGILLELKPGDFTRQGGMSWTGKG